MSELITLERSSPRATAPKGAALWQLGFRPFYLLASSFAALSIALWAMQFAGWLPRAYLAGPLGHAHEMLFGFTLAVVVGFLFTAGRAWSNRPTPTGLPLAALATLWLAARVLVLTRFAWAAALVCAAFPVAAAIALAIPFWASRSRRNYFFVGLLVLMGAADLSIHLSHQGVLMLPTWLGVKLALDMVLLIMAVMAGRVIPMFTNNAIPDAGATRASSVERVALGSVLGLLLADLLQLRGTALVALAWAAAIVHCVRWALWRPWKTWRTPLVWILQVAYAWIVLHLGLRGAVELAWVTSSAATHALTAGAIGSLIIGMMTRTARGHTGRPLRADRFDVTSYVLVCLSALVRVLLPLVVPAWTVHAVLCAALFWSGGFALYTVRYWPVLTRARLDGKPG